MSVAVANELSLEDCRRIADAPFVQQERSEVSRYVNREVVAKIMQKLGIEHWEAEMLFMDTLDWLRICHENSGVALSPPPRIDEAWHIFILFTKDYASFCQRFFGQFIHHVPHGSKTDPKMKLLARQTTISVMKRCLMPMQLASPHWHFPEGKNKGDCINCGVGGGDGACGTQK